MLLLLVLELNDVGRVSSVVVENDEDVRILLRVDGRVVERLLLRTTNRKLLHQTLAFHVLTRDDVVEEDEAISAVCRQRILDGVVGVDGEVDAFSITGGCK